MKAVRALLALVLSLLSLVAFGQAETAPTASLSLPKGKFLAGGKLKGVLTVTFAEGLHGYQNPPSSEYQIPVKVSGDKVFKLATVTYPEGTEMTMAGEQTPSRVYAGKVEIPVVIVLPAKPGNHEMVLKVDYQQCTEQSCFPPSSLTVKTKLNVVSSKPIKKAKKS
jgi:DsbC/DsbD-like thiol-disulfide interchange protein